MPWFPDFANAVALARQQTRELAFADPATQYFRALGTGDVRDLETAWPGEVVVYDPRVGEIRGHHRLRKLARESHSWLVARNAQVETVGSTRADGRAVVELLVHLSGDNGEQDRWPVAVVAESPDDLSVVFRTYCSQWPVERRRPMRSAILPPGADEPTGVVARYHRALESGDANAVVDTFSVDAYFGEPTGSELFHRGATELRSFFQQRLGHGGIGLQHCAITDDGIRCALEYNCVSWGGEDLAPQAGLGVYERGPDGLLAAARVYDDVVSPFAAT